MLIAKGSWFLADQDDAQSSSDDLFFRMTFAAASSEAVQEAVKRLGRTLRATFNLEKDSEVEGAVGLNGH